MTLPSSPEDFANQAAQSLPLSGLLFLFGEGSPPVGLPGYLAAARV